MASLEPKPQPGRNFDMMASELVRVGVGMAPPACSDLYERIVGQVENELIRHVMQLCDNVQIKAAARLGINRNTLHKKIQEMKLEQAGGEPLPDDFDAPAE